jgi:hypothetical protein
MLQSPTLNHESRSTFLVQPAMATLMKEMIEHYVSLDDDGLSTRRDRVKLEFMVSLSLSTCQHSISMLTNNAY